MVSVQSSYVVTPSQPTPTANLSLSHCDQIRLFAHTPLLYVYKPPSDVKASQMFPIQALRESLSQALVHFYPLAGRFCQIQGGRWELHCNGLGAQLSEAKCEASLDDLGDFAPAQIVTQLVPNIDYGCSIEKVPLLALQLTKFRCGGVTLVFSVSRAVIDGFASINFMNSWAKLTRGESLDPSEIPFLDRTVLDSRRLNKMPRFDHSEFYPPPFWVSSLVDTKYETNATILKISKGQVKKLKKKVSDFGKENMEAALQRPFTSFEVIAGLLWRCVCKARYVGNDDQPTRLSTLVDFRKRLRPPLPNGYFGCATIPTVTPTCTFDDLIYKPLGFAVRNIRQALERVKDEYLRSALDFIADQKDVNLVRSNIHFSTAAVEGQFKGNPNLNVVSWMNFPFDDADFGWGKPVYLGPGNINSDGKAFIMNNNNGDGYIVAICLQSSHMDAFKKLFYEDAGGVFSTSKL